MRVPPGSLRLLGFIAFLCMWLASVASESGGMTAFASELQAVEQGLSEAPASIERASNGETADHSIEWYGGVICENDPRPSDPEHQECADARSGVQFSLGR
jgi:hypothetical protein